MPRRIPDYADGYADWNSFMTYGSILTIASIIIFLILVSNLFKLVKTNKNWLII